MKSLKVYRMSHHQNKENAFKQALTSRGWYESRYIRSNSVAFGLFDADWRAGDIENLKGRPYFLYPHAARPMVQYDGCVEPKPVTAMFTQAPGGKDLMKIIGYPYPVEVTGWAYSEVRPFQKVKKVKRILFAPIHPNGNGYLNKVDKDLNQRTLERLEAYCQETGTELSVRLVGDPNNNGLSFHEKTKVHTGKKNNSTADIENADVIIAHQTFAYLSVALGKPTVMMGEDVPPRSGNSEEGFCYVKHWEAYKDILMFPLDILQGDTEKVIQKACEGSGAVEDWKARFIGEPFNGPAFVKTLESYL